MRHGSVWRARALVAVIGFGAVVAVTLAGGSQAWAETTSTTETAVVLPSLAIEPQAGYQDAVSQLSQRNVAELAGDPVFDESGVATRVQMAVYLARALQLPKSPCLAFGDVGAAFWGYSEIGAVYDAGLMQGTSPTKFSPDDPVSRQEAAALILAALRHAAQDQETASSDTPASETLSQYQVDSWLAGFRDKSLIDPRFSVSVALAYRLGLFDAPDEGWLLPKLGITHQELIGMLDRAFAEPLSARTAVPTAVDATGVVTTAYPKLSKGSKGALVVALQLRLNALNYPCGEPDGKYSNQTRDAVYAFQKYERLKRTGFVDQGVWDALFAASAPVPVYQGGLGRRVEVDLTRQIMMLIQDNKVVMTIHVSTGKHGTPVNNWHIRTLSHGWRMCSLGPIYSPCYFSPHDAIHGYPSVPTYPASHGCIRTPIWIQDEIVDELVMGEAVHVFYNKAKPTT
jgi:hypothetical protein